MSLYSKGTWEAVYYGPCEPHFFIGTRDKTGSFHFVAYTIKEENARLITAAPELYEAVCDLLDYAYEALHLAGGENETRGKAPRILREIQEYQQLIDRINGKVVRLDVADN